MTLLPKNYNIAVIKNRYRLRVRQLFLPVAREGKTKAGNTSDSFESHYDIGARTGTYCQALLPVLLVELKIPWHLRVSAVRNRLHLQIPMNSEVRPPRPQ
jgi:hypothetical protein